MDEPRLRDRLFFALTCYASVLAWVALVFIYCWSCAWYAPVAQDIGIVAAAVIGLFLTLPVPGILIGLGTGALLSRDARGGKGAMIGFACALFIELAVLAC